MKKSEPSFAENPENKREHFQKGGTLTKECFYLKREADHELITTLLAGESCHLRAARQVGKSSLRLRAIEELRHKGRRVGSVDLSTLGTEDVTDLGWYYSFVIRTLKSSRSKIDVSTAWDDPQSPGTPADHFERLLSMLADEDPGHPLVLFVDEIDHIKALPFCKEALLRLQNIRTRKVAMCFIGGPSPYELEPDVDQQLLSIGRRIEPKDFRREELSPLEAGLKGIGGSASRLLDEIFTWTNGHAGLTQTICYDIVFQGTNDHSSEKERVEKSVRSLFLEVVQESQDGLITNIEAQFEAKTQTIKEQLLCYRQILQNPLTHNPADNIQEKLLLSGLVREEHGMLYPRNKLFSTLFNMEWVESKLQTNA